jgi:peptidoglycan/LPS O-acetylase OafA/YrhL
MIDPKLSLILGALAGFIALNTRLRPVAKLLPVIALLVIGAAYVTPIQLPSFALPALTGAGAAVAILSLGGK